MCLVDFVELPSIRADRGLTSAVEGAKTAHTLIYTRLFAVFKLGIGDGNDRGSVKVPLLALKETEHVTRWSRQVHIDDHVGKVMFQRPYNKSQSYIIMLT